MIKAIFGGLLAALGMTVFTSTALAWTTPLYQPIGYTNGSWDWRSLGYECSYWCQLDTGTAMIYGDGFATRIPGIPSAYGYVASVNPSSYMPQGYDSVASSYWNDSMYDGYNQSGYGYDYRAQPWTAYSTGASSGYYGDRYWPVPNPQPLYVGPRGGNTYATAGYYPYVATRPYIGF